jgi:hypothetical protein
VIEDANPPDHRRHRPGGRRGRRGGGGAAGRPARGAGRAGRLRARGRRRPGRLPALGAALAPPLGATDEEVGAVLPGDDIIPDAAGSTTRAITIDAVPTDVWPWLVQLGYDRAGWYSYDWIDNDGRPSADRVVPELQDLAVGDRILMGPGMGPAVRALEPNRYLVAGDREGGSWCLALRPGDGGTRLVSRWRVRWPLTPATVFWVLLSDPGAFIMERRMLKGIKERVEGAAVRPAA